MGMQTFVCGDGFRAALALAGLQHVGVVGRARYDAAAPAALAMELVQPTGEGDLGRGEYLATAS